MQSLKTVLAYRLVQFLSRVHRVHGVHARNGIYSKDLILTRASMTFSSNIVTFVAIQAAE